MATINPFKAWHYESSKVAVERVIAPPYDVISREGEAELHKRDPHNVIRLILGQAHKKEDLERSERYTQAKKYLDAWIKKGVLCHDHKLGYYLYETTFKHPYEETVLKRLSVFALMKLEPFERRVVFPHEKTHSSAKVDRGKLIRATQANFSPIFSIYEDQTRTLDQIRLNCEERKPLFAFEDDTKTGHKVWTLDEPKEMSEIKATFDQKRIFIADGHHRYETALKYAAEKNGKKGSKKEHGWDYVLGTFVRFTDPGLLVLPIHRIISNAIQIYPDIFLAELKKYFVVHPVARAVLEKISQGSITEGFGVALAEGGCYLLELKDKTRARQVMPEGKPQSWYDLDTNLVSYLILEPSLEITEDKVEETVSYTASTDEAFDRLAKKEAACAFIIRPLQVPTIKEICESGELMPQKSTYFFPKFPSGLMMYRHD